MIRTMTAKFPGTCSACDVPIKRGDYIEWDTARKRATHDRCARLLTRGVDPNAGIRFDEEQAELTARAYGAGY